MAIWIGGTYGANTRDRWTSRPFTGSLRPCGGQGLCAGCGDGGHEVRTIAIGELEFPLVRSPHEWESEEPPEAIAGAQVDFKWAEHIVLLYPLWLGDLPAVTKGFLEQVARPQFAFQPGGTAGFPKPLLKGRSARVVVTMGMPALFYRLVYRAHSLKSLTRNILKFIGLSPVRTTIIGSIGGRTSDLETELAKLRELGRQGK